MSEQKTVLVDFDGTLSYYDPEKYPEAGPPIKPIFDRIKAYLDAGVPVKIFTARLDQPTSEKEFEQVILIQEWCHEHGLLDRNGNAPPVTNRKTFGVGKIIDDRAVSVEHNTGWLFDANIEYNPLSVFQAFVLQNADYIQTALNSIAGALASINRAAKLTKGDL